VLTVVYVDPVYGTPRSAEVKWTDDTPSEMWYASAKDGTRITSATDGSENDFIIVVKGMSPTRDKADTILVTLSIGSGEVETFTAVETGPFTGEFRIKADYRFVTGEPKSGNGIMDAKIDPAKTVNQAVVTGEAKVGGKTVKADIALLSIFDQAISAWAKDEDGDGRADHMYFRFDHNLARLPDGLPEAYWNEASSSSRQKAGASQLSFAKGDSSLVIADFSKSQFGLGLTGIPEGRTAPYAVFPDDNLFGGQSRALADSVGPIPVSAALRRILLRIVPFLQGVQRLFGKRPLEALRPARGLHRRHQIPGHRGQLPGNQDPLRRRLRVPRNRRALRGYARERALQGGSGNHGCRSEAGDPGFPGLSPRRRHRCQQRRRQRDLHHRQPGSGR
jgi:hypothetical protein